MINTGEPADDGAGLAVGDLLGLDAKDKEEEKNDQGNGRRPTVEAVLDAFKKGNRDVNNAYMIIKNGDTNSKKAVTKERDEENIGNILQSLEQLTDILNKVTYFSKAYDILRAATKDINGSPALYELLAR